MSVDEKTIAADEALCAAATPGEWRENTWDGEPEAGEVLAENGMSIATVWADGDLRLIPRACTALPEYIAEVRRLRAEVAKLESWMEADAFERMGQAD